MKKLSLLFTFCIGLSILSCSPDDNKSKEIPPLIKSEFSINGNSYEIPNGYILSFYDGIYNSSHAIYLINGTIINNEWYGEACDYSDDLTQGVIFNITSTSITELAPGTYNYELMTSAPSLAETSISTNIVVSNTCITSTDSINEDHITRGELIIKKSENTYQLTFTFETNDFGTVKGSYSGKLDTVVDLSN